MLGALTVPPPPDRDSATVGRGFTLVELLVVVAIVAVLAAIALPSMREFVARKRLEGVAQELATDLRLLKAHQIQNRPGSGTSISFASNSTKTCYMLYARGSGIVEHCNCAAADDQVCGDPATAGRPVPIRQIDIPASTGITITANPTRLTVNYASGLPMFNRTLSVTLSSPLGGEIQVSTNPTGLPAVCSVSGAFGSIQKCSNP